MLSSLTFGVRQKRPPIKPTGPTVTINPQWSLGNLLHKKNTDTLHLSKPASKSPVAPAQPVAGPAESSNTIQQAIKTAREELTTPQQKKVWDAIDDLARQQKRRHIRQLDIHDYLRAKHGQSVDSNIILPLISRFEQLTGLNISPIS